MAIKQKETRVGRGDVYWVKLDPTIGTETRKTRPAVIISNDSQNKVGSRYIIAPITSTVKTVYPFEAEVNVNGNPSKVMLDQIRTVDHKRLREKLCKLLPEELGRIERAIKVALHIA